MNPHCFDIAIQQPKLLNLCLSRVFLFKLQFPPALCCGAGMLQLFSAHSGTKWQFFLCADVFWRDVTLSTYGYKSDVWHQNLTIEQVLQKNNDHYHTFISLYTTSREPYNIHATSREPYNTSNIQSFILGRLATSHHVSTIRQISLVLSINLLIRKWPRCLYY